MGNMKKWKIVKKSWESIQQIPQVWLQGTINIVKS